LNNLNLFPISSNSSILQAWTVYKLAMNIS